MAARSITTLSLSFGLVSIPVKLYSATDSESKIKFNLLAPDGSRLEQQYVSKSTGAKVERADMKKGYEFEKDHYVTFTKEELVAFEESPSHIVEILAFMPEKEVDPIYFDKAYFIAPDKRGAKPYSLLRKALEQSRRCALAGWSYKGKTHIVQVRPTKGGLAFQVLLWGDEVRSIGDLHIEDVPVSDAELQLALKIIEQGEAATYDPNQYEDEEKKRVLAAIDAKIAGKQIVVPKVATVEEGGQVIDLMEALRASLAKNSNKKPAASRQKLPPAEVAALSPKPRKTVKRVEKPVEPAAPAKVRARR